jgi:hypothetical protein
MRVGNNPNKIAQVQPYAPIALAVVTHLPNMTTAYHSQRLEVVQTCLRSMREGVKRDHTFMVWDNGSIPELRNWLQFEFKPDVLILSRNVGKINARTSLAGMLPPETVFCYSDDDMLFADNWLEPQIVIGETFPQVACITGYPVRTAFRWGVENTIRWARKNGKLETGRFIPQEYEDDFALSVGRTPEWHRDYTKNDLDYRVTYNGKQAYCTAHHCQFIAHAGSLAQLGHYDNYAMADEKPFDIAMDKMGLRLATTQRVARHIGNKIDDSIRSQLCLA